MKKAALYVRVSTSYQIDKDSLPLQREELIKYCKYALNIDDYEIFEDAGYSAKNTDRPAFQDMIKRIKQHEFTNLIVWKIDRISRNLLDFCNIYNELKEYNCEFVSKNDQFDTSTASGEAMLKIILVFAELERKLTSERVTAVMLNRAEKGLWNGSSVPLGYKYTKDMTFPAIDDNESIIVKYIFDLYLKLNSTIKVSSTLNNENVKTKRGGKWTCKTVNGILRNPFYIGTYRYNVRNSGGSRRWKEKSEWIVVENNHAPIIDSATFNKVNDMLTSNYKWTNNSQRLKIHEHIFSRILACEKCGSSFVAGLDTARSDGYRPSRYTCYSNKQHDNYTSCNNFVSDITLLPFILNYISNFINLQNRITAKHSLRDLEKILLRGKNFLDVECIDKKALEETYLSFASGFDTYNYNKSNDSDQLSISNEIEKLNKEKTKFETALSRLDDLYLYSEEPMPKKDYLFKKRDITNNLEEINSKILNSNTNNNTSTDNMAFLNKANHFLIANKLNEKRDIDFRELLNIVDKSIIRDFIHTAIDKIVISNKKVYSITFKNGLIHNFLYKPKENQTKAPREKFLYKSFESNVIEYLSTNDSISRMEIESLVNITRSGANSIIQDLLSRDIIEKKGNSIAIRYFLKSK